MAAFQRGCGFKGMRAGANRLMGNLTRQYYRVGGHSWQFPPAIAAPLDSAPLAHATRDCSLCECSHQGGRDGEEDMRSQGAASGVGETGGETLCGKSTWSNGL